VSIGAVVFELDDTLAIRDVAGLLNR